MEVAFDNLKLLPTILEMVMVLTKEVEYLKTLKTPLKTNRDVEEFLDIGRTTLFSYCKNDILKDGVHYTQKNGKRIYNEEAIIEFKETFIKNAKAKSANTLKVEAILKSFAA